MPVFPVFKQKFVTIIYILYINKTHKKMRMHNDCAYAFLFISGKKPLFNHACNFVCKVFFFLCKTFTLFKSYIVDKLDTL